MEDNRETPTSNRGIPFHYARTPESRKLMIESLIMALLVLGAAVLAAWMIGPGP